MVVYGSYRYVIIIRVSIYSQLTTLFKIQLKNDKDK